MEFKIKIPSPPLNQYIESIVYFRDYVFDYSLEKRLPDGKFTLVIDLTDTPKAVFTNYQLHEHYKVKKGWLSGVQQKYLIYESSYSASMMVVEFKPGYSYPFIKVPLHEFADCTIELEDIWGSEYLSLRRQIIDSESSDTGFKLLENFLLSKLTDELQVNPYVSCFIENLQKSPHMITLVELIKNIGYSKKHFIDLFKKNVGTTPKYYSRIKKFQEVITHLEHQKKINWAQVATDHGYYDQAHFINEFRNFSGLSPTAYKESKGDFLNYIPLA